MNKAKITAGISDYLDKFEKSPFHGSSKPKFTIPKPMNEEPEIGSAYYVPDLFGEFGYEEIIWRGSAKDYLAGLQNLCFNTSEDAIAAKYLMRAAIPMYEALEVINKYHDDTSNGKSSKEQEYYAKKGIVSSLAKARGES